MLEHQMWKSKDKDTEDTLLCLLNKYVDSIDFQG